MADGDTVLLDVGTTTTAIARALVARADLRDVTVVTNGLTVALVLERAWPRISVVVTGGTLRPLQHSLVNPLGTVLLDGLNASIAFIGCNGVDGARRGDQRQPARGRGQARDAALRAAPGRGGRRLEAGRGRGGEDLRPLRGEPRRHRRERRPVDPRRPRGGRLRRAGRRAARGSLAAPMGYAPIISPQLAVRRGREAIEFYKAAFGAIEVHRVGGTDEHESVVAQLAVGDASFWVADESPEHQSFSPETLGGGTVKLLLIADDPRRSSTARSGSAPTRSTRPSPSTAGCWAASRTRSATTGRSASRSSTGRRRPGTCTADDRCRHAHAC